MPSTETVRHQPHTAEAPTASVLTHVEGLLDRLHLPVVTRTPPVTATITVTGCQGNARAASRVEVHYKNLQGSIIALDPIAPDGTAYRLQHQLVSTLPDPGGLLHPRPVPRNP
jgi:carboxypeptidase T